MSDTPATPADNAPPLHNPTPTIVASDQWSAGPSDPAPPEADQLTTTPPPHTQWERDPDGDDTHIGADDQPTPGTESPPPLVPHWERDPDGEDPVTTGDEPTPTPEADPDTEASLSLVARPGDEGRPDPDPSPFFVWGHNGAPIVFAIHDAGHDLRMWHPLGERLSEAYQLLAIDLPGHGTEPLSDFAWSIEDAAFAARELLANAGVEIAAVVGCGLGARIAAEIAVQQPGLVAALVLADIPPAGPELEATRALVERRGPAELGGARPRR